MAQRGAEALGHAFANWLMGSPSNSNDSSAAQALERQNAQRRQQDLERSQRDLQEEMDRQAEMRRQAEAEWLHKRNETYAMLKGPKPMPLGIKGGEIIDLGVKDVAPPSHDRRDLSSQWKRLHCATYLSEMANKAANQGKPDEAKYLSEQSAQAMAGGELGVVCPQAPPAPVVHKESPQDKFYTALMQTTQVHLGKLQVAEKELTEQKEKKDEAQKKVQERREEVQRLEQAPAPAPDQPKPDPNLLAQAQQLLHEAENEEAQATQAYNNAMKEQQNATAALQRDKGLYDTVQANPQEADRALAQLRKR